MGKWRQRELDGKEEGEIMVGMYCMREETIFNTNIFYYIRFRRKIIYKYSGFYSIVYTPKRTQTTMYL